MSLLHLSNERSTSETNQATQQAQLVALNALVNGSGPIGYKPGNGAGGSVTQATSRTTGVTLNTLSGQIKLVSAAGSTTPAKFTVTNSQVALVDTISLSQQAGADHYVLLVSNITAGTFDITAYTTGGTTTEQPIINFNVIKGAAS